MKKPVVLIIMDGIGIGSNNPGNAYNQAKKPNLDRLFNEYPNNLIEASGLAVGLPEGQMGNSEVGHMNIGAGRVVYQSLTRINKSIKDGEFGKTQAYLNAFENTKSNNSKLHLMGLLSNGGVHSHINHFKAMLDAAKENGVKEVFVHAFLDGRDVDPTTGAGFIRELQEHMKEVGLGKVASVSGRYYAMDRDKNWERNQLAYDSMTFAKAPHKEDAAQGVEESYAEGVTDEFVKPFIVDKAGLVESNDSIIFMNFRPDRAIQISTAYSNPAFVKDVMDVEGGPTNLTYVSTMKYADSVKGEIAFGLNNLDNMYGDYISAQGLNQLRIAETQKYAHVTFFFDGGVDKEIKNAKRVLIPSPKVATFDLKPEMGAYEITDAVEKELDQDIHDTVILNFANGDMVGHTGNIPAAIKAVETVDECVGRVVAKVLEHGGVCLVTADHGNCEKMLTEDNKPFTAHTTNLVPLIITDKNVKLRETGKLGDLAPTMLKLLGLAQPKEMTGVSIVE